MNIFCIGIGGIGVSGLAEWLHLQGNRVSGVDTTETAITKRLQALGIPVFDTHAATQVLGADLVVYSSAVSAENPERQSAVAYNIPQITRGELLAKIMTPYCGIAVAGTHGKTTTSGLLSWVFEQAQQDPSFMLGGILRDRDSTMRKGASRFFIAEADESDASFLKLSPTVAVLTNVEADHMETYGYDMEKLKQSFLQFAASVPPDGLVVLCIDDPVLRELRAQIKAPVLTYGQAEDADYHLTDFSQNGLYSKFQVNKRAFTLQLTGVHNALNACAAIIVADYFALPFAAVASALSCFPGMRRRFHPRGEMRLKGGNALVFDDYGHHPTELRATLTAAKLAWPNRRILTVFQPHRYTRTRDLMAEFVAVLQEADALVITEVYAASEMRIPGADGAALHQRVMAAGKIDAVFVPILSDLPAMLTALARPEDVIILQGAGNIVTMAQRLVEPVTEPQ